MANSFQVTAKLAVVGPVGLQKVAQKLNKDLSNIKGSVGFDLSSLNKANQAITKVKQNLASLGRGTSLGNIPQQLNAVTKATKQATAANAGFTTGIGRSIKTLGQYAVAAAALSGVIGGLRSSVVDWQSEFVKISQITGTSTGRLKNLKDEIHSLATNLGTSSRGLVGVSNTLAQAGLSARDTKVALKALASTQLAPTFGDINRTVEGSISIMGAFGTGVDKLEGQLGSMNSVAAKFAVESDDIIRAVQKSGAVFHQAGGSLNELMGLFTSVRAKTRLSADQIANSFNTIFSRLQRPRTIASLEERLGISLSQNGMGLGPLETIKRISEALKNVPDGSLFKASIAEEIGGIRQIGKTLPLLNQFATTLEALKVAEEGQGSLALDVARSQESLAVQLTQVKERWQQVFDTISDSSVFKGMASSLFSLAKSLAAVTEQLIPLAPAFSALAGVKIAASLTRGIRGHATGGFIGGSGNGDTVPAMLTPGEFVLRKSAVQQIGLGTLTRLNKFGDGGPVGRGEGYGVQDAENSLHGLSTAIKQVISTIRDEVSKTRSSRAGNGLGKGSIPLSDDRGYSLATNPSRRSRARAAMQFATALPLSRMSFDESAAAVASGGSGDFRSRPATYGLAPVTPYFATTTKNRNFRGMSRADREARIAELGGSPLLSRFRRNALAAQQATYLDSIGLNQPATPGIASRVGSATARLPSFLKNRLTPDASVMRGLGSMKNNLPAVGFGVAALATSQPVHNLIQQGAGHKAAAGFQGVVGGALAGGTLGMAVGGPLAMAAGAAVGGVVGLVTAMDDFKRTVADQAIEGGLSNISSSITDFANAVNKGNLDQALNAFGAVNSNRSIFEGTNRESSRTKAEPSLFEKASSATFGLTRYLGFGRFVDAYNTEKEDERQRRENLEYHSTRSQSFAESRPADDKLMAMLMKNSKSSLDLQAHPAFAGLISNRVQQKISQRQTAEGGRLTPQREAILTDRYTKEITADFLKEFKSTAGPLRDFQMALKASAATVEAFSERMADKAISNQRFDFVNGIGSAPRLADSMRFGSEHFGHAMGVIAKASPENAANIGSLLEANKMHNILSKNPSILGTDEGRANLSDTLIKGGVSRDFANQAHGILEEKIKTPNDFSPQQMLATIMESVKPLLDEVKGAGTALNKEGDFLASKFGHFQSLRDTAGGSLDQLHESHLNTQRMAASIRADRLGGRPSDFLSLGEMNGPITASQERLSGLKGNAAFDPGKLADQIASLTDQQRTARQNVADNPGNVAAERELASLTNRLGNTTQALKSLTDATRANTAIQEKLESLNADKAGRQNFFEQFASSDAKGRREMMRDKHAAELVQFAGNKLDRFSVEIQQRATRFNQQNRDVMLGNQTGEQHLLEMGRKSFGGMANQPAPQAAERARLQQMQLDNARRAERAQGHIAGIDQKAADDFGARLAGDLMAPRPQGPLVIRPNDVDAMTMAGGRSAANRLPEAASRAARYREGKQNRRDAFEMNQELRKRNPDMDKVQQRFQRLMGGGGEADTAKPADAMNPLADAMGGFNKAAPALTAALKGMPHTVTFEGKVKQEIIINGAEALARMSPELLKMIEQGATQIVEKKLAKHFPDAGPFNS